MEEKKQGLRPHYVQEWAESYGMRPVDLAREAEVDKSLVTKWYQGSTPGLGAQQKLAALFKTTREGLFRHPDEAWMADFLAGRSRDEAARIRQMLQAGFPKKDT